MNRRSLVKILCLTPLALVLPKMALAAKAEAAPANALPETDPMGSALKYKADATKAEAIRTDKKAFCSNCSKFNKCAAGDTACKTGAATAAYAPCELFAGKQVAAKGWCLSWAAK